MMNDAHVIGNLGGASDTSATPLENRSSRFRVRLILAAALVLIVTIAGAPETHWEMDEILFHMGVEQFNPLQHHPHPPGYPLLIGLGKFLNLFIGDPFVSLVTLAIISVVIGFAAFVAAIRNITGSEAAGFVAGFIFFFSPAMIIHGPTPMSDPPALMFLALALWAASGPSIGPRRALLFGVFAAASIGCRPQYAVPILPALALVLIMLRDLRARLAALLGFTTVCFAWIVPLISATGGLNAFLAWQSGQASWVAEVDAGVARHALGLGDLVKRFVAHPWGPKWISIPILLLAGAGAVRAVLSKLVLLGPLVVIALVHLVFTIVACDPADGVRYILPTHLATAAFVSLALVAVTRRLPASRVLLSAVVSIFVLGSYAYVWPLLYVRSTTTSPPVAAVEWLLANVDENTVTLYDDSVLPHVEGLLSAVKVRRHPAADADLLHHPSQPAVLFGEGSSLAPDALVFRWPDSDAYGKITRNHYRTVTLDPLEPRERFVGLRGLGPWQSSDGGARWRWVEQSAEIEIPGCCGALELLLGFPPDAPWDEVALHVSVADQNLRTIVLHVARSNMSQSHCPMERDG